MTDDSMILFGYKCNRSEEFFIIFGFMVDWWMLLLSVYVINSKDFKLTVEKQTIQFMQKQVNLSAININPKKVIVWHIGFTAAFYTYNENQLFVEKIWLCGMELNCFLKASLNSTSWREVQ